jgi:hypothetical protein
MRKTPLSKMSKMSKPLFVDAARHFGIFDRFGRGPSSSFGPAAGAAVVLSAPRQAARSRATSTAPTYLHGDRLKDHESMGQPFLAEMRLDPTSLHITRMGFDILRHEEDA